MSHSTDQSLSRRHWLGLLSTASLGSGLLAVNSRAAEPVAPATAASGTRVFNIRDFGAKGDGQTADTAAVQAAVDACHADQGGTVLVPAGVFVIGTVELKSNVTLHLAAQGVLLGSAHGADYHAADAIPLTGDSTLSDGNVGLLYAVGAENITVEGPGTIDGQGAQFRSPARGLPSPAGLTGSHRPYHLLFYQCHNLRVQDIFLKDSAFHSVRLIRSRSVLLAGIHIHSRVIHNNDGFHFVSCEYVHVTRCDVQSQDDACALFGSCRFITVADSSFSTRWSVFRFGGGIAENITVSNCLLDGVYGCPIKMRCGPGSRFENISFADLVMNNVTGPISIGVGPQMSHQPGAATSTNNPSSSESNTTADDSLPPGIVRNISFRGLRVTVVKPVPLPDSQFTSNYNPGEVFSCITLNGFDDGWLENITFDGVHVTFPGGGTAGHAAVRDVPKVAGEYYAIGVPPACGLYARNVRGLTLQNVRFDTAAPDLRPVVVLDHVTDAAVNGLSVTGEAAAESVLRFLAVQDVLLTAPRLLRPAAVFLQVEGSANAGIVIDGGDIAKAASPLAFKNGAEPKSVKLRG